MLGSAIISGALLTTLKRTACIPHPPQLVLCWVPMFQPVEKCFRDDRKHAFYTRNVPRIPFSKSCLERIVREIDA